MTVPSNVELGNYFSLGHIGGRGGGGRDREMATTYLKSFKSGNTNCISLGLLGMVFDVGQVFLFYFIFLFSPVSPGLVWDDLIFLWQ